MKEFVSGPPRYHLAIKGVREQFVVLEKSSGHWDGFSRPLPLNTRITVQKIIFLIKVLKCVAVYCSVLQCVAECCKTDSRCVAVCCSVL